MKTLLKTTLLLAVTVLSSTAAFAQSEGGHDGNGGDSNEILFREVASNIGAWIRAGNAESLRLPDGVNITRYKSGMLDAIEKYRISFVTTPITVDGEEKMCRNRVDENQIPRIVCNAGRFASLKAQTEEQYRLIHHELAGLAGLETNTSRGSDYKISDQISAYLRSETVLRLPVVKVDASKRPKFASLQPYFVPPNGGARVTKFEQSCSQVNKKEFLQSLLSKMTSAVAGDLALQGYDVAGSSASIGQLKQTRQLSFSIYWTTVVAPLATEIKLRNGVSLSVGFSTGVGSIPGGKKSKVAFAFVDSQPGVCEFYNYTTRAYIDSPKGSGQIVIAPSDVWAEVFVPRNCQPTVLADGRILSGVTCPQ